MQIILQIENIIKFSSKMTGILLLYQANKFSNWTIDRVCDVSMDTMYHN